MFKVNNKDENMRLSLQFQELAHSSSFKFKKLDTSKVYLEPSRTSRMKLFYENI